MSRRKITVGSESVMIPIFAQDTSSTTGAGLGSLVYNTAGLAAKYRREGQTSWTTITLATATVGTYTSGGFIADGGPVTGGYEFCPPDAAVASGVRWVQIDIYGAANMLPVLLELELDTVNYQATNGKLPVTLAASDVTGNVAADLQTIKTQTITCAAGVTVGAYVGGTGAAALEATAQTILADTNELQTDWANNGRLDLILDARASQSSLDALVTTVGVAGAGLTAADDAVIAAIAALNNLSAAQVNAEADTAIADAALATAANLATVASYIDTEVAAIYSRLGAPVGASVSADIAAVKTDTGNLVTRITSTLFSGITSLAQWLGLMAGKQVGDTTARNELRATGAGSGTFDETTDAIEAIRDNGGGSVEVNSFSADALNELASIATITVATPTVNGSIITLIQGDDYLTTDSRQLQFVNSAGSWPDLTGAACVLRFAVGVLSVESTAASDSVVTPTGVNQRVDIQLQTSITSQLTKPKGTWELEATLSNGSKVTLVTGAYTVTSQIG